MAYTPTPKPAPKPITTKDIKDIPEAKETSLTILDIKHNIEDSILALNTMPKIDGHLPSNVVLAIGKLRGALIKLG